MTADPIPKARMTVDEFLVWAEGRPGRYELLDGEVIAMLPERARHALVKFAAQSALHAAIGRAALPCRMFPDGMTVRIDAAKAYEPDALVHCGPPVDPDAVEIPNPVILLEVLSPTTRAVDLGSKLVGYFGLPSVEHYLILDPVGRRVIHHRRGAGDLIETRIVGDGTLALDPPGLTLPVAALFADA
ncbi:Uma2 family endonuclease [Methylobacterium sp. NEAU 140]|uniref:Uma2 family endonuclease n=1 Tax=Methylobacterium sp. NEAU 140 TaxID=3064945 RepID=UPI002733F3B5|nr:Uma2 family endonuclease [Methylobacterium sp. NEAU 140]MDP4025692.1 Uma2 family endonuclease [Methylobacterium sp. NEAU 140]